MKAPIFFLLAAGLAGQTPEIQFQSEVRLVEVYATVLDQKGKYVDGLERGRFQVMDDGRPQPIAVFEANSSDLSCAILLDTTGSMARSLPVVKNAILRLVDQFRPGDAVAVYGFSTQLALLQDFTTDREAVKRAVLRTRPSGRTALFDALSQVAKDISRRNGKKVVVVFTDGQDNASVLNAGAATARAKKIGVPVYTVAQGEALNSPVLVRQLKEMAQHSGGLAYAVRRPGDVEAVFEDISKDLQHTYLLAYKAPPAGEARWRPIQVEVRGYRVRAREGYLPEVSRE